MDLRYLIDPIDPDTFKREHWEKRPLRIPRNQPSYYQHLMSLADLDQLLSNSSIHPSQIRVVRDGKDIRLGASKGTTSIGTAGLLEELYSAYRGGSTLLVQSVHERWKPLRLLCQALASEFSARFHVNTYLTPAQEKGFDIHYDCHDVFVLQVYGAKRWRLYESFVSLPLKGQPYDADSMKPGAVLDEFDLQAGDFLYIPRGHVHAAESCNTASHHLTVGIHTVTWATVILRALEWAIEHDVSFRESLPTGFAYDEELQQHCRARLRHQLALLGEHIDVDAAIREAVEEACIGRQPALEGHLLDLEDLERLELTTPVQRRLDGEWRVARSGAVVSVSGHGKAITIPAQTWPDLSFIVKESGEFTAADLPGDLDTAGRLTLVCSLVREGFLTISRSRITQPASPSHEASAAR